MDCGASSTTAFSWPQICNFYSLTWTKDWLKIATSSDVVEVQIVDKCFKQLYLCSHSTYTDFTSNFGLTLMVIQAVRVSRRGNFFSSQCSYKICKLLSIYIAEVCSSWRAAFSRKLYLRASLPYGITCHVAPVWKLLQGTKFSVMKIDPPFLHLLWQTEQQTEKLTVAEMVPCYFVQFLQVTSVLLQLEEVLLGIWHL